MIRINKRKKYDTDLTDTQWEMIKTEFGKPGNKSKWEKRELVNAVFYLIDSGCKWRQLPHDFPPYTTVWDFYHNAISTEIWDRILELLVRKARIIAERNAEPSYALIDSQSVKTVYASQNRGFDGGKN